MIGAANSTANGGARVDPVTSAAAATAASSQATPSSTGGFVGSIGMLTKDGPLGSASAPIHMVSSEGGIKVQAWRTLRTLALGFLLLSGVGALIEDRGISKGAGLLSITFHLLLLNILHKQSHFCCWYL